MSFSKKKSRFGFSGKYCTIGICLSQFLVGYDNNRDKSRLEIKKERERGGLVCIRTEEYELLPVPPLAQCPKVEKMQFIQPIFFEVIFIKIC